MNFKKSINLTPRFSDIDIGGHVHNSKYLDYFESGRIAFFQHYIPNWPWLKKGVVIAKNEVVYKQPVYLNHELTVETSLVKVAGKSLVLDYHIYIHKNKQPVLVTRGQSVLVCMDFDTRKSVPVFEEWRGVFSSSH